MKLVVVIACIWYFLGGAERAAVAQDDLWFQNYKCGHRNRLPTGRPAECNPRSIYPCCSDKGWCGRSEEHCDCRFCKDFRCPVPSNRNGFMEDYVANPDDQSGQYVQLDEYDQPEDYDQPEVPTEPEVPAEPEVPTEAGVGSYTVTGMKCYQQECQLDDRGGYWYCKYDKSGAWDYCCRPDQQCGLQDNGLYWCYVGAGNGDQWKPCTQSNQEK